MAEDVRQVPIGDSSGGGATANAPGAGSQFVGTTPTAGIYRVEIVYTLTGTTETSLTNVRLKTQNATFITGLPSITGQVIRMTIDRVTADGTSPISLVAAAASTAGSVYTGCIVVSRIG